jgi:hypothetical protein
VKGTLWIAAADVAFGRNPVLPQAILLRRANRPEAEVPTCLPNRHRDAKQLVRAAMEFALFDLETPHRVRNGALLRREAQAIKLRTTGHVSSLEGANRRVRALPFSREHRLELLDVGLQRGIVGLRTVISAALTTSVLGALFEPRISWNEVIARPWPRPGHPCETVTRDS